MYAIKCATVIMVLATSAVLLAEAKPAKLIESTFDKDAEGWSMTQPHDPGVRVLWVKAGDNAGGYLSLYDAADGPYHDYYSAPQKFLGDKREYYGGKLQFDMQVTHMPSLRNSDAVRIVGAGRMIIYHLYGEQRPNLTWRTFDMPLDASKWRVGNTHRIPSEDFMNLVLANIEKIEIRADWIMGRETVYLDNVRLIPPHLLEKDEDQNDDDGSATK